MFAALRTYRDQTLTVLGGVPGSVERQIGRFLFSLLTKRLLSSSYAFGRTWWAHVAGYDADEGDLALAHAAAQRAEASVDDDTEKAAREQDAARQGAAWLRTHRDLLRTYVDRVSKALSNLGWTRERTAAGFPAQAVGFPDSRWDRLVAWIREHLYYGDRLRSDERLIVFTEYRDTQRYLLWRLEREAGLAEPMVVPLYGGASLELREAVKEQFNDPASPLRILVATDAASEGLNLQMSCRYVLHQEIPWNPMRMEQRNGRVDRHGQARDVTVCHFTSDADADMQFLSYVAEKVNTVRDDLGSVGQVFDSALQAYFSGEAVTRTDVERRLALGRAESEEGADLSRRDRGEDPEYRRQLSELKVQELRAGLNPQSLARVFMQAVRLAGGQVEPASEPGLLHLTQVPPTWRHSVEEAFRGPGNRPLATLPRLSFDEHYFEDEVDGRLLFRPRPATVLVRLAHPIIRRSLATLRNQLWGSDTQRSGAAARLSRWTVASAGPDLPEEAVLVVWALLTATNHLREPLHEELLALPYVPAAERLHALDSDLWGEVARMPLAALPDRELRRWQEYLQEWWQDYRKIIRSDLVGRRERDEKRLTAWLAAWKKREADRETNAFAVRMKELEQGRDVREVTRVQQRLIRAMDRARQMTFDVEENAIRQAEVRRLQQELEQATFALQTSHLNALRSRLDRDRERILTQVIPQRFSLAHLDLQPVAVELRVRSYGKGADV